MYPRRTGKSSAPGKVILLGEHAVVYGWPAIASPVDRWVHVEVFAEDVGPPPALSTSREAHPSPLDLEQLLSVAGRVLGKPTHHLKVRIRSEVPTAMGLGSSAALSVALIRAVADYYGIRLQDREVSDHAYALECLFHGRPSGVDNTTVAYGTLLRFVRGQRPVAIACPRPLPLLVVLGSQTRSTRTVVERLQERRAREPHAVDQRFARIGALVDQAARAIARADWSSLAAAMNENHAILAELGISTAELDSLVSSALEAGAWAAKLTGAGGGGAIVCLCPEKRAAILKRFTDRGWSCFPVDWPTTHGGTNERFLAQSNATARRP